MMDNLPPFIPRAFGPPYADVASCLTEIFQSALASGKRVKLNKKCSTEPQDFDRTEITGTERQLMKSQAEFIVCEDQVNQFPEIADKMLLQRPQLYSTINEKLIQDYHLIQSKDLHGEEYEKVLAGKRSVWSCSTARSTSTKITQRESQRASQRGEFRCQSERSSFVDPRLVQKALDKINRPKPVHNIDRSKQVFEVSPKVVEFSNYEPGQQYECLRCRNIIVSMSAQRVDHETCKPLLLLQKFVKLYNITTKPIKFLADPLRPKSPFRVNIGTTVSAPGIFVKIYVTCRINDKIGAEDVLTIMPREGCQVTIVLRAYRDAPILKGIVLDLELDLHKCKSNVSQVPRQSDREKVLNRSVECGSCLLGDFKEILLVVKNVGGCGKFFLMSEDDWFKCTITDVTTDGYLLVYPFCMSPVYFELTPNNVAVIQTIFQPHTCGAHVQRVLLLCDNCTVRGADLLGDGVCFDRKCIKIDLPGKDYNINMDGDVLADYYLNLKAIPLGKVASHNFSITNNSSVELSFYWEVRIPEIQWTAANIGIQALPTENVEITPINGIIDPGETISFTLIVKPCGYGEFRSIVGLYASNIPTQSLIAEIPPKCVQRDSSCELSRVDVLISNVEIWLECYKRELHVEPCIIDLSCGNITGDSIVQTLLVRNRSQYDTTFEIQKLEAPETEADALEMMLQDITENIGQIPSSVFLEIVDSSTSSSSRSKISHSSSELWVNSIKGVKAIPEDSDDKAVQVSTASRLKCGKPCLCPCTVPARRPTKDKVEISPMLVTLNPKDTMELTVNINLQGNCVNHVKYQCTVADSPPIASPVIAVKTITKKNCIKVSTQLMDFGDVKTDTKCYKKFVVTNMCEQTLTWKIKEYSYNFESLKFEKCLVKNLSNIQGLLCHKDSFSVIKYNLHTRTKGPWLSLLEITPLFPQTYSVDQHYILVQGMVHCPAATIEAPFTNTAIMTPCELLYTGIPSTWQLTLRNYGKVPLSFLWSKAIGPQAYYLKVRFSPPYAIIEPGQCCTISVEITPKKAHIIDKFFVPCFIGRLVDPLILCIICLVEDLKVSFAIPEDQKSSGDVEEDDDVKYVSWSLHDHGGTVPLPSESSYGCLSSDSNRTTHSAHKAMEQGFNFVEAFRPEIELKTTNLNSQCIAEGDPNFEFKKCSDLSVTNINLFLSEHELQEEQEFNSIHSIKPIVTSAQKFDLTKETWRYVIIDGALHEERRLSNAQKSIDINRAGDIKSASTLSDKLLSSSTDSTDILVRKCSPPQDLNIAVLKFINLPTRVAKKKTVIIRNDTPIATYFTISIKNFFTDIELSRDEKLNKIQAEVNGIYYDEYKYRVPQHQGLIIFPSTHGPVNLPGHGCYSLDIWVYADTWGWYNDMITVQMHGLSPFIIPIFVSAVGPPVIFPMANNSVLPEPLLNFGDYSYNTSEVTRYLKIENACGLPVNVSWHCFLPDAMPELDEPPFNIILDLFNIESNRKSIENLLETSRKMDLLLTEFYGKENTKLFQITPSIVDLFPGETASLKIVFRPAKLPPDDFPYMEDTILRCPLVGIVRLPNEFKNIPTRVFRLEANSITPLRIMLGANLRTRCIDLEMYKSNLKFFAHAVDIMVNRIKKLKRTLFFKNYGRVPLRLTFEIEDPFEITCIRTPSYTYAGKKRTSLSQVHVDPPLIQAGESMEIDILCVLHPRHVWFAWESLNRGPICAMYHMHPNEKKKLTTLSRTLVLRQDEYVVQSIELILEIPFPMLTLSVTNTYHFGPVYVGDTSQLSATIKNGSAIPVKFHVQGKHNVKEIRIITKEGICRPSVGHAQYAEYIHIEFTPTEVMKYIETIQILTCLPFYILQFNVSGYGTNDSKYRMYKKLIAG